MVEASGHKDGAETVGVLLSEVEDEAQDQLMLEGWPTQDDLAMSEYWS